MDTEGLYYNLCFHHHGKESGLKIENFYPRLNYHNRCTGTKGLYFSLLHYRRIEKLNSLTSLFEVGRQTELGICISGHANVQSITYVHHMYWWAQETIPHKYLLIYIINHHIVCTLHLYVLSTKYPNYSQLNTSTSQRTTPNSPNGL